MITSTTAAPTHIQGHEVAQFSPVEWCTYASYPTIIPHGGTATFALSEDLIKLQLANDSYEHPDHMAATPYSQQGMGQDNPSHPSSAGTLQTLNSRIITLQVCSGTELPATDMGTDTSKGVTEGSVGAYPCVIIETS
jgi:hypothetical protein